MSAVKIKINGNGNYQILQKQKLFYKIEMI